MPDAEQQRGDGTPTVAELAATVTELRARVEALEGGPATATARLDVTGLLPALRELAVPPGGSEGASGAVLYAGVGPRGDGEVAWQIARGWGDVLAVDRARSSRVLAALSSPARLDIVAELLAGPVTRQELQERLERSSSGQLNHHLRELLAAGLVEQPSRGVYQVPLPHIIPILTLLSCAADLASGPAGPEVTSEQPRG